MITQKRINKKKIRSFFKKAILTVDIKFEAIKIKITILIYYFDKFMTYFALLKSIMNTFLFFYYSLLAKYIGSSNASIFLIKISWAFVSNFII